MTHFHFIKLLLGLSISIPVALFFQNYTLAAWMSALENKESQKDITFTLMMYLLAAGIVLLTTLFKNLNQAFASLRASKKLHEVMLDNVITATLAWHDSQPTGRKINRFSQDISTVDSKLMNQLQDFLDCLISAIQVVAIITWMLPWVVPFFLPVLMYNWFIADKYLKSSRELKRLESINKSPVFVLFAESLTGLSIIRSFQEEERFFALCCKYVDKMNRLILIGLVILYRLILLFLLDVISTCG